MVTMYPEVTAIQLSADDDVAVTTEYRQQLEALEEGDPSAWPTPGAFLADYLQKYIARLTAQHVIGVRNARRNTAAAKDPAKAAQADAILGVDTTVTPPPAKK